MFYERGGLFGFGRILAFYLVEFGFVFGNSLAASFLGTISFTSSLICDCVLGFRNEGPVHTKGRGVSLCCILQGAADRVGPATGPHHRLVPCARRGGRCISVRGPRQRQCRDEGSDFVGLCMWLPGDIYCAKTAGPKVIQF